MKIAICTPFAGDVTAEYAYSLAKLVDRTARTPIDFNGTVLHPTVEIFMRTSSVLPQLRNMLVRDAADWGADYLLWLDSDQKFPDDVLLRLLSLNLRVVGTNYLRRVAPHLPTARAVDGAPIVTTAAAAAAGEIVPAHSMGLGCCLLDMTVLATLDAHARAAGTEAMWPLFAVEMVGDGTEIVGEDVFFFRKLAAAGIPVHVDQAASWNVGHVHAHVLTHADGAAAPAPAPAPAAEPRTSVTVRFDAAP